MQNVTETRYCQIILSYSINTSLENPVSCFQELEARRKERDARRFQVDFYLPVYQPLTCFTNDQVKGSEESSKWLILYTFIQYITNCYKKTV